MRSRKCHCPVSIRLALVAHILLTLVGLLMTVIYGYFVYLIGVLGYGILVGILVARVRSANADPWTAEFSAEHTVTEKGEGNRSAAPRPHWH